MENQETKQCPYCGETIKATAKKCIHCKSWLVEKQERRTICQFCHEAVPEKAEKCPNCGEWLTDECTEKSLGYGLKNPVTRAINSLWIVLGIIFILLAFASGEDGFIFIILMIFFFFFTFVYMLPSICAASRKHPQLTPIVIVNLLFGETVIGWVGAMIWAYTHRQGRHTHW